MAERSDTAGTMKEFQTRTLSVIIFVTLALFSARAEEESKPSSEVSSASDEEIESVAEVDEATAEAAEEALDSQNTENVEDERRVYGWKEWVQVGSKADRMRAKLDSGARTSSLHAEDVFEFERDGEPWVQFTLVNPRNEDSTSVIIKAPIQRTARVKTTDGVSDRRHVVELNFQIGERQMREEFTLNDRSNLICPILIGRNALRHLGYLDCSRVDLADKDVLK
jgi:hypothetical protein